MKGGLIVLMILEMTISMLRLIEGDRVLSGIHGLGWILCFGFFGIIKTIEEKK